MRFQATFDRLSAALSGDDPLAALRQDPTGIAPERALVFVTAGSVSDFANVAQRAGLEVLNGSGRDERATHRGRVHERLYIPAGPRRWGANAHQRRHRSSSF